MEIYLWNEYVKRTNQKYESCKAGGSRASATDSTKNSFVDVRYHSTNLEYPHQGHFDFNECKFHKFRATRPSRRQYIRRVWCIQTFWGEAYISSNAPIEISSPKHMHLHIAACICIDAWLECNSELRIRTYILYASLPHRFLWISSIGPDIYRAEIFDLFPILFEFMAKFHQSKANAIGAMEALEIMKHGTRRQHAGPVWVCILHRVGKNEAIHWPKIVRSSIERKHSSSSSRTTYAN